MKLHEQLFADEDVIADGHQFRECSFTNCNIKILGFAPFSFEGCRMTNCNWQFQGSMAVSIQQLQHLYQTTARPMIDALIQQIQRK